MRTIQGPLNSFNLLNDTYSPGAVVVGSIPPKMAGNAVVLPLQLTTNGSPLPVPSLAMAVVDFAYTKKYQLPSCMDRNRPSGRGSRFTMLVVIADRQKLLLQCKWQKSEDTILRDFQRHKKQPLNDFAGNLQT